MKRIVLFCLLYASPYLAQTSAFDKPHIDVSATAETDVVPDEIYLTITLAERMEGRDKLTIEKQEEDLKKHVRELGISPSDLSLASADADYRRKSLLGKDVMVTKSYQLRVGSAEMLKKVYERLDQMNAHDAHVARVDHSRIKELQKENRVKAVKLAKEKAAYLLAELGKQVGEPLYVSESGNAIMPRIFAGNANARFQKAGYLSDRFLDENEGEPEISFKKITIRSTVHIKFEIR